MALLAGGCVVAAGKRDAGPSGSWTRQNLLKALAEPDQETFAWGWPV